MFPTPRRDRRQLLALAALVPLSLAAPQAAHAVSPPTGPAGLLVLSEAQRTALELRFAPVAPARAPLLSLPGSVVVPPRLQRMIAAGVDGVLVELRVSVGDRVSAGQAVARLGSPQLLELQRSLVVASTQRALAADTAARDERLHAEGLIPLARLRAAQARVQEADALLGERRRQLDLVGAPSRPGDPPTDGFLELRAPITGVVLESLAVPGQRLDQGAPILRVAQTGELWLELQAPAERAASIMPGSPVSWALRDVSARVESVGAAVGPGQSVVVRARIEHGMDRARPGESVQAEVRTMLPSRARWQVPAAAVARLGDRSLVFVARPEGVQVLAVVVHARDEDSAMLEAPLTPGDRVVVAGVAALKAMAAGER